MTAAFGGRRVLFLVVALFFGGTLISSRLFQDSSLMLEGTPAESSGLKAPVAVYYSFSDNFGDGTNPLVFNYFLDPHPTYVNLNGPEPATGPYILGIGSILSFSRVNNASQEIVCGSGFITGQVVARKPLRIISVRGPLTRQMFLDAGIPCPERYGDLGLLFRYIVKPPLQTAATPMKKFKYCIIPHYIDKTHEFVLRMRSHPGCKVIDIEQASTPQRFVEELHDCAVILSSALHGIIISDSYGIPAYHMPLSDKVIGGDFKFRDYFGSVGREYSPVHISGEIDNLDPLPSYTVKFDFDHYYKYISDELSTLAQPGCH